jgi:hypothetical protein
VSQGTFAFLRAPNNIFQYSFCEDTVGSSSRDVDAVSKYYTHKGKSLWTTLGSFFFFSNGLLSHHLLLSLANGDDQSLCFKQAVCSVQCTVLLTAGALSI